MSLSVHIASVYAEIETVEAEIEEVVKKKRALRERLDQLRSRARLLEEQRASDKGVAGWEAEQHDWDGLVQKTLEDTFRLSSFRELQKAAVNLAMSREDCIVVMSTGAGKSLCYQLPAVAQSEGVTLVVCPLISLMEDQLMHLQRLGVRAASFTQHTAQTQATSILNDICRKESPLQLLYVTPEKLAKSKRFMNKLEKCYAAGLLNLIAIDEVHCCSHWGHDFRPDYKFLGILKRQFPRTPLMGLSATATVDVLSDVTKILRIEHCLVIKGRFNRPNLRYEVRAKPESAAEVVELIHALLTDPREFAGQSGIIYCLSRKDCEQLSQELRERGVRCAFYHGDLDVAERSRTQTAWADGALQVIVATVAFGMGIDKPDVRFVIHHSVSKSMENYYQESGRAGRDGLPARCLVLYRIADIFRQSTLNYTEKSFSHLYGMMTYCAQSIECRRKTMALQFGEEFDAAWCERACDFCADAGAGTAVECDISWFLELVREQVQAASKTGRLTGNKVLELAARKAKHASRPFLEAALAHLLARGLLREDFHFTPYSVISYLAVAAAEGEQVTMLLDPARLPPPLSSSSASSAKKRRRE